MFFKKKKKEKENCKVSKEALIIFQQFQQFVYIHNHQCVKSVISSHRTRNLTQNNFKKLVIKINDNIETFNTHKELASGDKETNNINGLVMCRLVGNCLVRQTSVKYMFVGNVSVCRSVVDDFSGWRNGRWRIVRRRSVRRENVCRRCVWQSNF